MRRSESKFVTGGSHTNLVQRSLLTGDDPGRWVWYRAAHTFYWREPCWMVAAPIVASKWSVTLTGNIPNPWKHGKPHIPLDCGRRSSNPDQFPDQFQLLFGKWVRKLCISGQVILKTVVEPFQNISEVITTADHRCTRSKQVSAETPIVHQIAQAPKFLFMTITWNDSTGDLLLRSLRKSSKKVPQQFLRIINYRNIAMH